ncbi:MAG: M28 family peptidase [Actinomycetota bacterium]
MPILPAALALYLSPAARMAGGAEPELITPPVRQAMNRLSASAIQAHVRHLSDDSLEGRDTSSAGGDLAARYLASHLEKAGLRPGGDNGSYFQQIPFVRSRVDFSSSRLTLTADGKTTELAGGDDFLLNTERVAVSTADSGLVFAGHGISAPEFKHDDYAGLDARGKWVIVLTGEPASHDPAYFAGDKDTPHADGVPKQALAKSKGARGMITILIGDRATRFPWDRARRSQEATQLSLPSSKDVLPAIVVRKESAPRLFEGAEVAWDDIAEAAAAGPVPRFRLASQAKLTVTMDSKSAPAPNVVGYLEGSDPQLKKQVVIYSAHYDHIGRRSGEGDTVFNGAWDNASGTAEVLEVASTFARLEPRPKRSVLFLFVTGEEKGLLGSDYYARRPRFPIEDTAANINLDMTEIFGIGKELVPQGAERSTLMRSCEAVAKELGLKIGKDPTPELNVFTRSDQFSFVKVGVPSLFLRWSNEHEDLAPGAVKALSKQKLDTIYHKESDEFDPTWSWEGMRRHAQSAFLIGLHVASRDDLPAWNEGDEFNRPRKRAGGER